MYFERGNLMAKNILLIEPGYKNKYPPLGLMKISTYHKKKGDNVVFAKGEVKELKEKCWDRIYISTLFTFYWNKTINTIKYYYKSVNQPNSIFIGGVMATILEDDLRKEPGIEGITILSGLLDKPGALGEDNMIVDTLTPDYDIINLEKNKFLNYCYPVQDAYITYTTRGCIRSCSFCAVPKIEREYNSYISIKEQIENINGLYGSKRNLMLLDNNILASKDLEKIIDELVDLGFGVDNNNYTYYKNGKKITVKRYVDFNQGTDARLINEDTIKLLSKLPVNPLRIAFDHADETSINYYVNAVRLAAEHGFKVLSNYILFNYQDTPEDFYKRLEINIKLNEEFQKKNLNTRIWSFPMKYSPVTGERCRDRKYIGASWNAKLLRGIQCVLNATHGVVGPKKEFFNKAFGRNLEEFYEILYMPEDFIINRDENVSNGNTSKWLKYYHKLGDKKAGFISLIENNKFEKLNIDDKDLKRLYRLYL